jgi:hypothetical protein
MAHAKKATLMVRKPAGRKTALRAKAAQTPKPRKGAATRDQQAAIERLKAEAIRNLDEAERIWATMS